MWSRGESSSSRRPVPLKLRSNYHWARFLTNPRIICVLLAWVLFMFWVLIKLPEVPVSESHAGTNANEGLPDRDRDIFSSRLKEMTKEKTFIPEHLPPLPKSYAPGFSISRILKGCNVDNEKTTLQNHLQEYVLRQKCAMKRESLLNIDDFICSLGCDKREPELEKSMRILQLSKYKFRVLQRLCSREQIDAVIWIRQNEPHFIPCGERVKGTRVWNVTQRMISMLLCMVKVPNVMFGFSNHDWATPQTCPDISGWNQPLPGIVRYVGTDSQPSVLFPTAPFVKSTTHCGIHGDSPKDWIEICGGDDKVATISDDEWEKKTTEIFWRGSATGVPLDVGILNYLPRPALMMKFHNKPGYDLGFVGGPPPSKDEKYLTFFHHAHTSPVKSSRFKARRYILHMDGHTASWGLAHKLSKTGSAILWVPSAFTYREHYYIHLDPWEHYIPVDLDFSNLEDTRQWLLTHEGSSEAKHVAERATNLFVSRFRPEATYCYILRLFLSLAAVQQEEATDEAIREAGFHIEDFQPLPQSLKIKK